MRRLLPLLLLAALAAPVSAQTWATDSLTTRDGVRVPAYLLQTSGEGPFVLLFHQGGASGRAEYETIAPRLAREGFRVLTIDQRRGGDLFGGENHVAARFDEDATSYCDAAPELEAALAYARARTERPVVLWGSSYSAALVIRLAAERPGEVAGVLAFSPASGDSMDGCRPEAAAVTLGVPLLALRPASEMEYDWIAEQLADFEAAGHRTHVARPGRHGSSMLVEERVGADTAEVWRVVSDFLAGLDFAPS